MDLKRGNKLVSKKKIFSYLFYIDKKSINTENHNRKINERSKRCCCKQNNKDQKF